MPVSVVFGQYLAALDLSLTRGLLPDTHHNERGQASLWYISQVCPLPKPSAVMAHIHLSLHVFALLCALYAKIELAVLASGIGPEGGLW